MGRNPPCITTDLVPHLYRCDAISGLLRPHFRVNSPRISRFARSKIKKMKKIAQNRVILGVIECPRKCRNPAHIFAADSGWKSFVNFLNFSNMKKTFTMNKSAEIFNRSISNIQPQHIEVKIVRAWLSPKTFQKQRLRPFLAVIGTV
jgi:hypothetical protein